MRPKMWAFAKMITLHINEAVALTAAIVRLKQFHRHFDCIFLYSDSFKIVMFVSENKKGQSTAVDIEETKRIPRRIIV